MYIMKKYPRIGPCETPCVDVTHFVKRMNKN
jgi:hypothetical protein